MIIDINMARALAATGAAELSGGPWPPASLNLLADTGGYRLLGFDSFERFMAEAMGMGKPACEVYLARLRGETMEV